MATSQNVREGTILQEAQDARLSVPFLVFMATSGVLAAVALLTNSVPVLIGAMVVAPAFSPLMLVALALAGGRPGLAARGFGTALLGLGVAVLFAMVTTWFTNWSEIIPAEHNILEKPLLEERVRPGWYSVIAAVAAGLAGTLATIRRKKETMIGIVAAVALVPAGAAGGIALMSGDPMRALGGLVLLAINIGIIIATALIVIAIARPRAEDGQDPMRGGEDLG